MLGLPKILALLGSFSYQTVSALKARIVFYLFEFSEHCLIPTGIY